MEDKPEKQTRDKPDAVEYIREYMLSTSGLVVLSEKQLELYERIKTAWSMLVKGDTRKRIAKTLCELYEVSEITAIRDMQAAVKLFGEISKADKEGMRHLLIIKAEKAYSMAKKDKDVKGMNDAIKNLIKITGVEREDPDLPDFTKLEQHNYIIIMPDAQRINLEKMIKAPGSIDLNNTEDAEYEELHR